MEDLKTIEDNLERERQAARARGWRDLDLLHAFRRDRQQRDLLEHLDGGIEQWRAKRRLSAEHAAGVGTCVLHLMRWLPAIPPVDTAPTHDLDASVLGKVRGLLAKAESTEFQPEAEALFAKAHDLMTRYSIDQALLQGSAPTQQVSTRRVLLDEPYAHPRFVLLAQVARALGCRVLGWSGIGIATVFGMADDVEATELLYTSLLLQATTAMLRADSGESGTAPSSVAAFRRAFLIGFAQRVGTRLSESRAVVVEQATAAPGGGKNDLLPVLANRAAAVDAAFDEYATQVKRGRPRSVSNLRGLTAGHAAGSSATLTTQRGLASRRALAGGGRRS